MKVAVIGGTGLIGSQVVKILNASAHEAVPHSPSTGLDLLSGQGLPEALAEADVVVNLTNSPTFDEASSEFFQKTMANLLTAAKARARRAGGRLPPVVTIAPSSPTTAPACSPPPRATC